MGTQIGGYERGPKDFGTAITDLRFDIEKQKSVKDVVSQKSHEQETFDGLGMVLKNMIGIPSGDQFVESIIFDIPSLVTKMHYQLRGGLGGWKSGDPKPVTG